MTSLPTPFDEQQNYRKASYAEGPTGIDVVKMATTIGGGLVSKAVVNAEIRS